MKYIIMKNQLIFILLFIISVTLVSCTKRYCAECTSASGYTTEFCGSEHDVDYYLELKQENNDDNPGINWVCYKTEE